MDSISEADEPLEKFSPLADRRPFEVVLRGGKPWGFTLAGGEGEGSPLHIAQIEACSSAENSALLSGDVVLSVNGISCGCCQAALQLIDSAFRTLTLKVIRGGWEPSRAVRPYSSYVQRPSCGDLPRRERGSVSGSGSGSGSVSGTASGSRSRLAHDDSALYAQSKASQQSASSMRPSRIRRGDSFSVGRSNPPPSPSAGDPPWSRPSLGHSRASPQGFPRSSYPDVRDVQRPSSSKDRRYSDAPPRHQARQNREHPMVTVKSSPNLNKSEAAGGGTHSVDGSPVKPVKSSSDIPDDLEKENYRKRPSMYDQQMSNKSPLTYGKRPSSGRHGNGEDLRGDHQEKAKRYSEDMYTADMKAVSEPQSVTSHSLQKYQPDYENVAMLGTAPLKSEKISEIDFDDSLEGEVPVVPPRPSGLNSREGSPFHNPPIRDPSSLKYIKVNQNHEKYPSWPVTQPNAASDPSQPINVRAQSWTDHTNTNKEFPSKQRLAYQPGLRPLLEKNSPVAERKGDDSSGKARNSSDPGFKHKSEFMYDKYGKVVQRKNHDGSQGKRFEEFYVNSKPGYLPPRFDSDGHSYGDKEYNAPSPPERDVTAVDQQVLSQALGAALTESHQHVSQEGVPQSSHLSTSHHLSPQSPVRHQRPSFLAMSHAQRVDMATSPLASPLEAMSSPREHSKGIPLSVYNSRFDGKDSGAAHRAASKAFVVRQTPYYNTSTQTEVPSGRLRTAGPQSVQCNVEIQVGDTSASSQTSPFKEYEEKSIQARMSREFQPSDLEPSRARHSSGDEGGKRNYFQYPFEGMQSIQAKYATDEDQVTDTSSPGNVFSPFNKVPDDQASIMRKLSEEFYGNKLGLMGDKRHSSASSQEHSPKPLDPCSVSVYSGTMSQAESYSSVVIHPSESAGPFGRDDFGSQSSITDSRQDLSGISSSRSSLRDSVPRGRNSLDPSFFLHKSASRPLQESKKFNSLTLLGHHRESSAPVISHHTAVSQESLQHSKDSLTVDTGWRQPGSYRNNSSSASEASSPSQPKSSPDTRLSGSTQYSTSSHSDSPSDPVQPASQPGTRHVRLESADSVFTDSSRPREKTTAPKSPTSDNGQSNIGSAGAASDVLMRKASMKKAYGIYDETEKVMRTTRRDGPEAVESGFKSRSHSQSDSKLLGLIQEVNEGDSPAGQDSRSQQMVDQSRGARLDSWRDDLEKRTGRMHRTISEQIHPGRDRSARLNEPSRPQRLFDGSIDSGVGSEVSSRGDGQVTPSEPPQPGCLTSEVGRHSETDLKKVQQQAVWNFVQRKTHKPQLSNASSVQHSPESSLYESIGTPRSPHSPTSETVSDLISKTNENLAKRADSIRRTGSVSSRASSSDYVDMGRERSRKETEWSRLRSSGSFHYGGSNRSSVCSDNTYEDISVFATPTPRGSTQEMPKDAEMRSPLSGNLDDGTNMESGVMASQNHYQNFNSRRRPPPPPPRPASPEVQSPPALPPRNYLRKGPEDQSSCGEEGSVEEAKIDFKSLVNQWEHSSPREDTYAAQLRRQAMRFSGQQRAGSGSGAAPSSMSVIVSRTQMGISTSYTREPMIAQEATQPAPGTSGSCTSTSSVSSQAAGASPAVSSTSDFHAQSSFPQTKDSNQAVAGYVDRDTKPAISVPVSESKPPQLPERTALPLRVDNLSRERSGSDVYSVQKKEMGLSSLSPPEISRDRSASDTRVFAKQEVRSSGAEDKSPQLPKGKENELPLPSPPRINQDVVVDGGELPPPPPELLNDSGSSLGKGDDIFADDSYGAYKNRSNRQVGSYKRSASSSIIRPDNNNVKVAADASAVFTDRKLGKQTWSSESQLLGPRREVQQNGGVATPPDRPPHVPAFRVDSRPVHSVTKVTAGPQPLPSRSSPHGASPSSSRTNLSEGGMYTARPYHVDNAQGWGRAEEGQKGSGGVSGHQQPLPPRSVKDRVNNLERKSSFTSPSPSSTPSSSPAHSAGSATTSVSQRWANAAPFEATHRGGGGSSSGGSGGGGGGGDRDALKPRSNSEWVPGTRPVVLADSQPRERPSNRAGDGSSPSYANSRPRSQSERAKQFDVSPPSQETQRGQRLQAEVSPPAAPDWARNPGGHVRNSSQDSSRTSHIANGRRESAPAPHIPPHSGTVALTITSPRRQSEGDYLSSPSSQSAPGGRDLSSDPGTITVSHGRQPSQEELECDQKALELAKEVAGSEKKLSDVLSTAAARQRMQYMDGLFPSAAHTDHEARPPAPAAARRAAQSAADAGGQAKPDKSPAKEEEQEKEATDNHRTNSLPKEYFVSTPKAVLEMEWRKEPSSKDFTKNITDNEALIKQKEELVEKLYKKMDLLKEERTDLQQEITDNDTLGKQVFETVEAKCQSASERDKFRTYIDDLEKIVRLLLNLSGQLARAENAVQGLAENADPKLKKMTLDKRERLQVKHAEAKQLKEDIDKRSDNVTAFLRQSLSAEELKDYALFVKMKSKLMIELQELEDKITLGHEQIQELKKSIPEHTTPPADVSSSSLSPPSSPAPSS